MAVYTALTSLGLSLQHLLNSSQVSLLPPSQEIIQSACHVIKSIHEVVKIFSATEHSSSCSEQAKALDQQIREAVYRVEDMLEAHLSSQYLSQNEENPALDPNCPLIFAVDLEEIRQDICSFIAVLIEIKEKYVENLKLDETVRPFRNNMSDDKKHLMANYFEIDDEIEYKKEDLLSISNYQMVGLVDAFIQLRSVLLTRSLSSQPIRIIGITGMAGMGKTTLAEELYNDPLILNHFKYRAFVSIGPKYQLKQVIRDILSQIENHPDIVNMQSETEDELVVYLLSKLTEKRCLLVLDDVWSHELYAQCFSQFEGRKSRILLTTRILHVATSLGSYYRMRFLNEEESWSLLCEKVFGKDSRCPFELMKVGKEIAKNCEGLPLAIIAVADLLAKGNLTVDFWQKVSEDPNPLSIGMNGQHPKLDVLHSSYDRLPQFLKTCFLYMGVFPRKHKIVALKLIGLWIAEGFVDYTIVGFNPKAEGFPDYSTAGECRRLEIAGRKYIDELSSQSVVLPIKLSSRGKIKTCKLHSVFWHLCVNEARKESLFQVVDKYSSSSFAEVIKGQRRLCVHNNTLFGIKDAYNSMSSISNARSLLCTGLYHDYPIPMCFGMKLLRVLEALSIRFYKFPLEVVKLVQLRYLSFTYNGMLHSSICQLWNLQVLIVQPHLSIISPEAPCYLPLDIWKMKELTHLQVRGALLPNPSPGAILPKLSTVLDINAQSLTAAVVCSIPNVKKLSIRIDSSAHDHFSFADNLCSLINLESLKCIVVNPKPKSQVVVPPSPNNIFPSRLRKLTLSGFGYPWKYMKEIGRLKYLEVLKLRNYAFQGLEWESYPLDNLKLKFLHLEDLDLVHWTLTRLSLCDLERLVIRHCYKLQEIPLEIGLYPSRITEIFLVEVTPSVLTSVGNILQSRNKVLDQRLQVYMHCTWRDEEVNP